ncbi:uncharacterized protein B0H18DRAFT_999285 [Fomitopsis serialis]|uniref:uncharacterized protein n=1 Tax=Fomitopsis serialis TaxID=139415 RepID=UPI002008AEF3|nr:uncharacterized protein B0H18DRAFT_999285 [Neoantrodia serialis]KAH9928900.1 hypothetical protein B0H18DRAFT_999285 [Neoantrodia serialis]
MSQVKLARLHNPTKRQLDEFEALFVLTMSSDLAAISICGGDQSLIGPMARAMILAATLGGEIYAATEEGGAIVGCAVWMPPGQELLSTPEQRQLGWNDFFAKVPQEGKDWFTKTYSNEVTTFINKILGPTGKLDSWYLNIIMVHPEHQGRGIATKFISIVRENASAHGTMMALSTSDPRNVPIYKALHFEQRGDKRIPSPWGDWSLYIFTQDTA